MEESSFRELQEKVLRLQARVELLEEKLGIARPAQAAPVVSAQVSAPESARETQPAPDPQPVSRPAVPRESWEHKIGGTWLNRLGVVALLIGLAFFLKYAFDNNWINEVGRVAIGYSLGGLLLAGGFWYRGRGKLPKFGSGLGGAGIGAWFISTWAAYNYYQILAPIPAFAVMGAVTIAGVVLALYWNSPALAGLGLLGGYLTPLLIQGVGGHMTQFIYLLILNIGALAVLVKKNWNGLAFISLGFTTLINLIALINLYEETYLIPFMLFISAYHLLFAIQGLSANLLHRSSARPPVLGISLTSGGIYLLFSAILLFDKYPGTLALIVFVWGMFYLAQMAAVQKWRRADRSLSFVLLCLALAYITLAVPIRFSGAWITMIWAVQAAVLIVTGWRTGAARTRGWGLAVLMLAMWRLVLIDLKPLSFLAETDYAAPWADRLPALVLVAGVMLLTAWLYSKKRVSRFERGLIPCLLIGTDLLLLVFVLGEWSRWFYHLDNGFYNGIAHRNTAWSLTMLGNLVLLLAVWARWRYKPIKVLFLVLLPIAMLWSGLFDTRLTSLELSAAEFISPWAGRLPGAILLAGLSFLAVRLFADKKLGWLVVFANAFILLVVLTESSRYFLVVKDSLTQPWQVYSNTARSAVMTVHGFILVAVGVWRKSTLLRRLGIGLLLITVAKITLVDLTGLETVWRILVFIGTGMALILASWLYQKFVSPSLEK